MVMAMVVMAKETMVGAITVEMAGMQAGGERRSHGSLSPARKCHSQSWRHHRRIRGRRKRNTDCCRSHRSVAIHSVMHSEVP